MGNRPSQLLPESGVNRTRGKRSNKEVKKGPLALPGDGCGPVLRLFLFSALLLTAHGASAQTPEQLVYYAERIEFGTEDVKRDALAALRNFETEAASRVALPALLDPSEVIRATAVQTVVHLPAAEAFDVLNGMLGRETSLFVRREIAYALGSVGTPQAAGPLAELLLRAGETELRAAAAIALGRTGEPSAVPALTRVLSEKRSSKKNFLRRSAARAVGDIARTLQRGDAPVVTPESFLPEKFERPPLPRYRRLLDSFPVFRPVHERLIAVLRDPKETNDVRREAAFALGEIGDAASIPVLRENVSAADPYLAEICEEALRRVYQNVNLANTDG